MSVVDDLSTALFGNPPVAGWRPDRAGVLSAFTELYAEIASSILGLKSYTGGVASLPSDSTIAPVGTQARVTGDSTPANNTLWLRNALTGSNNGWIIDADLIASIAGVIDTNYAKLQNAWVTCATYGDRGAILNADLYYGKFVYVKEQGGRLFEWGQSGVDPVDVTDPTGAKLTSDGWVGWPTPKEFLNIALSQADAADQIVLAPALLLAGLEIDGFRAEALSPGPSPLVDINFAIRGSNVNLSINVAWANWTQYLSAKARSPRWRDWTKSNGILSVGNSFQDAIRGTGSYVVKYAASLGLAVTQSAVISADPRQTQRLGIDPLHVTVTGNQLPAGDGTASVAITAVNGAGMSSANPYMFMETYDGDTGTAGNTLTAMYGGVHGTVKTAANGTYNYTFIPDVGSPATFVPAGTLLVPDYADHLVTDDIVISGWQNSYYSPFTNADNSALSYINPTALAQVDAIVRASGGHRVQIMGLLPDATEPSGTTEYTGLINYNNYMRATYPHLYVVDASGNDFLQTVLLHGNNSSGDNADIAAGVTPRSLRRDNGGGSIDSLHLSPTTGDVVAANLLAAHRAIQMIPPPMPVGTHLTITAQAQNGYDGTELFASDVTAVVLGSAAVQTAGLPVYASNTAATSAGLVAGMPYRTATGQTMVVY